MLYGDIDLLDRFAFPAPLEYALRFLRDKAASLPDGRHDLADGMFAEVKRYRPAPASERPFESHVRFIDVQYVLEGGEEIFVRPLDGMKIKDDLLAEKDLYFYHEPADQNGQFSLPMPPGKFLMLLPEDGHKTECLTNSAEGRKVIFKIPVALLCK